MKYTVYFEIYGKKMKTTVEADSKSHAMEIVKSKIKFHDVIPNVNKKETTATDIMDFLTGFGK